MKNLPIIGVASGIAANDPGCGDGPQVLHDSGLTQILALKGLQLDWQALLQPQGDDVLTAVADLSQRLAVLTQALVQQQQKFVVLGGDHACAIGTWSGVFAAQEQPFGLIWIDAHLDSHTFETTQSGNIHGMPVAALLGYGAKSLTQVLTAAPKLQPQHLCLIGVRSYEAAEAELLQRLGVRIYAMDEVQSRGLDTVFREAQARVKTGTVGYGISIDLDGIDPLDAPGVGCPEPNGLSAQALYAALAHAQADPQLLGLEIAEYNPHFDDQQQTQGVIAALIASTLKPAGE